MSSSLSTSRHQFLKNMSLMAASMAMPNFLMPRANAEVSQAVENGWKITGAQWGAVRAKIEKGRIAEIKPFELDKHPTEMINGIKDLVYGEARIRYPMMRLDWLKNRHNSNKTQRGDNRFVRVSWDEALDLFYEELERIQQNYGPWALHTANVGWRSSGQFHSCGNHMIRAIAMHGSSVGTVGNYSTGAGQTILSYVLGSTEVYSQGTSWEVILKETENLIFWASDPVKNLQVGWNCETHESYGYLEQLKQKVAEQKINVISVDPVKSKTSLVVNSFISIRKRMCRLCWRLLTPYIVRIYTTKRLLICTRTALNNLCLTYSAKPKTKLRKRPNGQLRFAVLKRKKSVNLPVC